jgi:hypothetical protein
MTPAWSIILPVEKEEGAGISQAAHGRAQLPQEKPPCDAQELELALALSPEPGEPQENEDMSLHVSFSPQIGHTAISSGSEGNMSCSKVLPHFLHWNS